MSRKILFIRFVYWFGAIADLLLFLEMLLINYFKTSVSLPVGTGIAYEYMLRGQASLMLGWTMVLIWAQIKPVLRKEVLLFTGILIAAGLIINIENILHPYQLISIFTMLIYFAAYFLAAHIKKNEKDEEI